MVTATVFHQFYNKQLLPFSGFYISYYLMGGGSLNVISHQTKSSLLYHGQTRNCGGSMRTEFPCLAFLIQ